MNEQPTSNVLYKPIDQYINIREPMCQSERCVMYESSNLTIWRACIHADLYLLANILILLSYRTLVRALI